MNKFKIKVYKVKDDKRLNKLNSKIPEPFPKINSHMLISAPSGTGKSNIISNLLLGPLKMVFDRVIFFSPTFYNDIYPHIMDIDSDNIYNDFNEEILNKILEENKEIEEEKGKQIYTLFIMDDIQEKFKKNGFLENYICLCRHHNISIFACCQYSYAVSKRARQQFTSLIVFPNFSSEEDLKNLAEIAPGGKQKFNKAVEFVQNKIKESKNNRDFLFINKSLNNNRYFYNFEEPINL